MMVGLKQQDIDPALVEGNDVEKIGVSFKRRCDIWINGSQGPQHQTPDGVVMGFEG
jgi:hypothetical protein